MRSEIYELVRKNPDWVRFLREQPIWYRKLSRNPNDWETFEISALHYFRKTIPHKVEQFSQSIQMATMMMSMFQAMNQSQNS
ncbi:YlbE-like protein [Bacillus oleivorans]|uniref:YlbE-like protein n=1 Tax=Bacillus oleivorans TaxID=1448271 RepID=A0A285D0G9_9BACI|nr:YlbE-like family protein [Bacillus oleivorans]SNX73337.1 YlbE-like protein [Bacillus oleivorans]